MKKHTFESQYILNGNLHIERILRILYLIPVTMLLLFAVPHTASAEPLKVSLFANAGGQMFDWASSVRFSANGSGCTEANGLWRKADGSFNAKPALIGKAATIGLGAALLYIAHKTDNKAIRVVAKTLNYASGGVGVFNGVRNVSSCGW